MLAVSRPGQSDGGAFVRGVDLVVVRHDADENHGGADGLGEFGLGEALGALLVVGGVEQAGIPHASSSVGAVITVSVGVAHCIPKRDDSYLALIKKADEALYEAKRQGRNRVVVLEGSEDSRGPMLP